MNAVHVNAVHDVTAPKPTIFFTVPTMLVKMLEKMLDTTSARPGTTEDHASRQLARHASLRFAVTAGEPLPPAVHRAWDEETNVPLVDGLGQRSCSTSI